jgi:ArsR family transcriptional regulator
MGHVWLGFSEEQLSEWLTSVDFVQTRIVPLPPDADAKGPALFSARAVKKKHSRSA